MEEVQRVKLNMSNKINNISKSLLAIKFLFRINTISFVFLFFCYPIRRAVSDNYLRSRGRKQLGADVASSHLYFFRLIALLIRKFKILYAMLSRNSCYMGSGTRVYVELVRQMFIENEMSGRKYAARSKS